MMIDSLSLLGQTACFSTWQFDKTQLTRHIQDIVSHCWSYMQLDRASCSLDKVFVSSGLTEAKLSTGCLFSVLFYSFLSRYLLISLSVWFIIAQRNLKRSYLLKMEFNGRNLPRPSVSCSRANPTFGNFSPPLQRLRAVVEPIQDPCLCR
jgi:hypothetical protein